MRKLSLLLLFTLILSFQNPACYTASVGNPTIDNIVYISDDLYLEIYITEESASSTYSINQSKNSTKTIRLRNKNGDCTAEFSLIGTFTYNGTSSKCTKVSYDTTIYDDVWKFSDISTSKSGNKASAEFTAKKTFLFATLQTINQNVTITCDANGKIS